MIGRDRGTGGSGSRYTDSPRGSSALDRRGGIINRGDAAQRAVDGVGGLDLVARDAEDEQHGVEERLAQRRVGDLAQGGLRVEGDAQARGTQHVDVVGAVADGVVCSIGTPASAAKARSAVALPARSTTSPTTRPSACRRRPPGVLARTVEAQLVGQRVDDLAEPAGDDATPVSEAPQCADRGARPGVSSTMRQPRR